MDLSPFLHACAAVAVQCIFGLVWGNWASSAVTAVDVSKAPDIAWPDQPTL